MENIEYKIDSLLKKLGDLIEIYKLFVYLDMDANSKLQDVDSARDDVIGAVNELYEMYMMLGGHGSQLDQILFRKNKTEVTNFKISRK